jgi:hypothetical protein
VTSLKAMGQSMDDHSFYDEGLVAAACGMLLEHNPCEVGTVRYRVWREGFISYGRARHASPLELPVLDLNLEADSDCLQRRANLDFVERQNVPVGFERRDNEPQRHVGGVGEFAAGRFEKRTRFVVDIASEIQAEWRSCLSVVLGTDSRS